MVNSFDPIQPHGAFHGLRARHVLRGFLWDNGLSIVFAFFLANYLLPNGLPASSDLEIDAVFGSPEYNLLFLPIGLCCTGFGGYLAAMRCVGAEIKNAVAVNAGAVHNDLEAASGVLASLQAQRESISGVNLDEEAISLLKYERAFQGAARFVTVVNDLLEELIRLVR